MQEIQYSRALYKKEIFIRFCAEKCSTILHIHAEEMYNSCRAVLQYSTQPTDNTEKLVHMECTTQLSADDSRDFRSLLPCADEMYSVALEILPFNEDRELRVLDFGTGTGIFSNRISAKYPRAQLTLADTDPALLTQAEQLLDPNMIQAVCPLSDLSAGIFHGTFDLVISSFTLHQLEEKDLLRLFQHFFAILEPGGMFINGNISQAENRFAAKIYQRSCQTRLHNAKLSPKQYDELYNHLHDCRAIPLPKQLNLLTESGFSEVTTWYQLYCFAVYSGIKSGTAPPPKKSRRHPILP